MADPEIDTTVGLTLTIYAAAQYASKKCIGVGVLQPSIRGKSSGCEKDLIPLHKHKEGFKAQEMDIKSPESFVKAELYAVLLALRMANRTVGHSQGVAMVRILVQSADVVSVVNRPNAEHPSELETSWDEAKRRLLKEIMTKIQKLTQRGVGVSFDFPAVRDSSTQSAKMLATQGARKARRQSRSDLAVYKTKTGKTSDPPRTPKVTAGQKEVRRLWRPLLNLSRLQNEHYTRA